MQILNTIIPIISAVLLLYFLNKKENSTQIKTDMTIPTGYQYELEFYIFFNGVEAVTERFVCGSDCYYKDPFLLLKRASLIQKEFLILPQGEKITLIRIEDIKKITMGVQKNKTENKRHVPKFGTQMKRELYDRETKE